MENRPRKRTLILRIGATLIVRIGAWLSLCLMFTSAAVYAGSTDTDELLAKSLVDISQNRVGQAQSLLDRITASHPNFRLAQLIKGDMLLARAQPLSMLGNTPGSRDALEGLRDEARQRVKTLTKPLSADVLPSYLLDLGDEAHYALVVDTSRSRLYVFANRDGMPIRVADYYVTIGKAGPGKQKEGDNRTPVGIYHVSGFKSGKQLGDFYGGGAFTLSYPNEWDEREGRSGHGIWIHGTPSNTYSRPPLSSEGCVVLANDDLHALGQYIEQGKTPILITGKIDWEDVAQIKASRAGLEDAINQWRSDWESLSTARLLDHYSRQFRSESQDYAQFADSKKRINSGKSWIKVGVSNMSMMLYPDRPNLAVISFNQDYKSNNVNDHTHKKQYWSRENGHWKIIQESQIQ
jgi:murein L,D-transpeptidase YafK